MVTSASIYQQALEQSLEVREEVGADFRSPVGIFDLCDQIGVTVRFVNISMEGITFLLG